MKPDFLWVSRLESDDMHIIHYPGADFTNRFKSAFGLKYKVTGGLAYSLFVKLTPVFGKTSVCNTNNIQKDK